MEIYDSDKYRCIVLPPMLTAEDVNDEHSTAEYMRQKYKEESIFDVGDSVFNDSTTWRDNIKESFAQFNLENPSER